MPPPGGGGKRKRVDRTYSDEGQHSRPSPHRPGSLNLAQQGGFQSPGGGDTRDYNNTPMRGRGGRRPSRGGRGGGNAVSSPVLSPRESAPPAPQPASADVDETITDGNVAAHENHVSLPLSFADPPPEPQVYNYTYLTTEICDTWQTGGMEEVLRLGLAGLPEEYGDKLTVLMQELVLSVIYGRLDPLAAGQMVQQMLETEVAESMNQSAPNATPLQAALLDSISVVFDANPSVTLDRLSAFLLATGISYQLLRVELDASLLEKLDLIRNTFNRMGIRKQTNLLYRQANFNLLREESEGFAKLMTELFTTSGNEPPSGEIVEQTVERVKAMIGAFDLDVGRSLDVVLDVFGAVLVKQFRFFVKLLRASPWWPRSPSSTRKQSALSGLPLWALPGSADWHLTEEQKRIMAAEGQARDEAFWPLARQQGLQAFYALGRRQATEEQIEFAASSGDELSAQWVRETGTLPPTGNRDAAQLLGFKLRFYSSSPARDETDVLPDNLIYLSALLIKIGFISLRDLYPHIWRVDEAMEELKQQKLKEKADRERAARPGAGARNALLMAGALADDTLPIPPRLKESNTRASTPSKEQDSEKAASNDSTDPADQKVLLLKSLLGCGALPEALFILGRFPWLLDLFPDLPEYIHRILHHCLSKVYGEVRPLQERPSLHEPKPSYETDIPGLQKGQVKMVDSSEKKVLRWALLDRNDSADGTDYRFYWDEWNDIIPICQTVEDVFTLCDTLLPLVGVKIGQDPGLLLKIARIGKHSLQNDKTETNRSRWLDLSKRILLPALSLTKSNAGVVNEVFELISNFPVGVRYLLYLEWASGRTSRNPDIKAAFDQARAETKDILKRISNTNVRPMARALAKIAFANPHIVITTALTQIEVYDSIAEVFVEGARYFTDLGYDVLTWAIVSSMAKAGRSRTQDGGIFTSRWLSALAQFAGKIYKRYGMMRPAPILQYVFEQLKHGNTTDLKMLEQIVVSMGGIATDTSYNDAQLQAMGGGPLLQSQTILQLLDRRHDSKKTSERLLKSLQDTGLAAKFLILMAQVRQACVFDESDAPLKAVGNTYDEVSRVMVQYLDLLRSNLSPDDFRATIPNVVSLLIEYQIRPDIAFWISRPLISKQILEYDREHARDHRPEELSESKVTGDVEMSDQINGGSEEDGEAVEADNNVNDSPTESDAPGSNIDLDSSAKTPGPPEVPSDDCWHPVMKELITAIKPSLPEEVVETIGAGFYATFWQLSLYDITIPGKSYEDELSRQSKKIAAISSDRSDVSVSGTKKKELAKKEISELVDKLLSENKQHLKAFAESKARLQREKDQWFLGKARKDKPLNTALMEYCFLPRLLSSALDAYFCFKFVKFLHGAGTPNFRTLGFYDLFFKTARLVSLIFICTSKEADNLGRFLNEVLKDLARWHGSKTIYEREGWGSKKNLPGFAMKVEAGKVVSLLDYESFRRVLYKWHGNLFGALQKCIVSPEYMHVRNAISVLRSISAVFPVVNFHGTGLQKAVDKLGESDKEDLKVSSQALLGALHRREKSWMAPQTFRDGQDKLGEHDPNALQAKSEAVRKTSSAGAPTPKVTESGEVKDAVMADAPSKAEDTSSAVKKEAEDSTKAVRPSPAAEPARVAAKPVSRPDSRPGVSNGASTPSRLAPDAAAKADPRPTRAEPAKQQGLPRRVSPPPSRPPPAHLPNRPEPPELRNGHRESPRPTSRLASDMHRSGPEVRPSHGRDSRQGYRGLEPPFDDYDRHARRYDRPDGPPHGGRDERRYGRDSERNGPYGRPMPPDGDRPPLRPPPSADRERDYRESGSRPRPAPPSEPPAAASQPAQKRDTTPQPSSRKEVAPEVPQVAINPARAALIEGNGDQRSGPPPRAPGPERPSRPSRPTSPRRDDDRRPYLRRDVDERQHSTQRPEGSPARPPPYSSGSMEPSSMPPNPRSSGPGGFKREPRHPPPVDMQHGRLEQEGSQRPSPSQGGDRPQDSDVPSGPRTRPTSGGGPKMRAPPLNTQIPANANSDRPTPTGPARRHGRTSSYNEGASASPAPGESTGVHPSRMNQIDSATTDPSQSPHHGQPPAGPRGNAPPGAPSGPSPTTRGPPSGPHTGDTAGRGGRNNRHPLTAVNNTLAQAGGTSIRGRGGMRQNSGTFASHMAPPPPPPPPGGPPSGYNQQPDLFASSNPNDVPITARPPASRHDSVRDRRGELFEERSSDRRSSRHSSRHDEGRAEREPHRSEKDNWDRDGKDDRHAPGDASRREDRPSRREVRPQDGDERRGGYSRSGPRDDAQSSRKHGRLEDESPYSGGPGQGGGGRAGPRSASDSKRVRRGP